MKALASIAWVWCCMGLLGCATEEDSKIAEFDYPDPGVECFGGTCRGLDPVPEGCAVDPVDGPTSAIWGVGTVKIRKSTACGGVKWPWASRDGSSYPGNFRTWLEFPLGNELPGTEYGDQLSTQIYGDMWTGPAHACMQIDSYNGGQKVCTDLDPDPELCDPDLVTGQTVAPGVQYYDCTSTTTKVHIVTIDRDRPEYEMWILDDPTIRNPPSTVFNLQTVPDFAASYDALAAVNGYVWSGDEGTSSGQTGTPQTTLYETGIHYTSNTSTCSGFPGSCPEVLMGFTPQSGNGLDVSRIPQDDLSEPANQKYTYTLYGSNSTVMNSDGCTSDTTNNRWSVIGYSPTQIVLLSTATDVGLTHAEICPVLSAFGVEEAVRQDGSSAAGMFVGGSINEHVNPLVNFDYWYYGGPARHVAYAVGLVQLYPRQVQNSGFEAPVLSPGEAWRRMTGASQETTLTGWNGPVDLHGATDLVAHGQQIIDLNQSGSGYAETTLATPADTHCLLRFYHGVNHHCNQQATFTVDIDGTSVASFTSTHDPNSLQEARVRFKTTGTTATLRFTSTTGGCGAATIDDVSVACTKQ